jgi:TetR/AcrR family transcriptional repressor of mexJK operon
LRVLREMEVLLQRVDQRGLLRIEHPDKAAEHFFCLLKGAPNYRLLLGYAPALDAEAAQAHVAEVVSMFLRAYRP